MNNMYYLGEEQISVEMKMEKKYTPLVGQSRRNGTSFFISKLRTIYSAGMLSVP